MRASSTLCKWTRAQARWLALARWPPLRAPLQSRQLAEEPREAAILEDAPFSLTGRAVVDRVLVEVDLGDRRAAVGARLAEPVVDPVGNLVRRASFA